MVYPSKQRLSLIEDINRSLARVASNVIPALVMVLKSGDCVSIEFDRGIPSATGFFINRDTIVSVWHLFSSADAINEDFCIVSLSGEITKAKLVAYDEKYDIAFLSSKKTLSDSYIDLSHGIPEIGTLAIASGIAYSMLRPFFSIGVVSSYELRAPIDDNIVEGLILVSTPILPGMSGGPLINVDGISIGMLIAKYGDVNEFSLAVPAIRILYDLEIFRTYGRIVHPKLGLKLVDHKPKLYSLGLRKGLIVSNIDGVLIKRFCDIDVGDVILKVNNVDVDSLESLRVVLDRAAIEKKPIEIGYYSLRRNCIEVCTIPISYAIQF